MTYTARLSICLSAALHLTLSPLAALATEPGRPMTGAEFEAATTGRTLYYNSAGQAYGVEQYLPGRRVIWAFVGDDCRKGNWYEDQGRICFVYENDPDPQCWLFFQSEAGLAAQSMGFPDDAPLIAVEQSPEPMACLGPNVGV
ncbi:MAG: hypothetical protein WBO29_17940 [Albidovulum sp.]